MRSVDLVEFIDKPVNLTLTNGATLNGHFTDNKDGTISFWVYTPHDEQVVTKGVDRVDKLPLAIERGTGMKILYESITKIQLAPITATPTAPPRPKPAQPAPPAEKAPPEAPKPQSAPEHRSRRLRVRRRRRTLRTTPSPKRAEPAAIYL